jgi:hypothetical protein
MLRIQASEKGIKDSKEEFTRVTYGLLGVLGLWLILFTVNKDMLMGGVDLGGLRSVKGGVSTAQNSNIGNQNGTSGNTTTSPSAGQNSTSIPPGKCLSISDTKTALTAGNICDSAKCSTFTGCTLTPYESIIQDEAKIAGIDPNIIKVIICKESRGKPNVQNSGNVNGTYDCGLMQVNQSGACTTDSYDIRSNIHAGATLVKLKLAQNSGGITYPGIPQIAKMFAAYGCCGTEGNPNNESHDCTPATGYPFTPPKWACPENPGPSATNMCSVRADVCGAIACLKMLGS